MIGMTRREADPMGLGSRLAQVDRAGMTEKKNEKVPDDGVMPLHGMHKKLSSGTLDPTENRSIYFYLKNNLLSVQGYKDLGKEEKKLLDKASVNKFVGWFLKRDVNRELDYKVKMLWAVLMKNNDASLDLRRAHQDSDLYKALVQSKLFDQLLKSEACKSLEKDLQEKVKKLFLESTLELFREMSSLKKNTKMPEAIQRFITDNVDKDVFRDFVIYSPGMHMFDKGIILYMLYSGKPSPKNYYELENKFTEDAAMTIRNDFENLMYFSGLSQPLSSLKEHIAKHPLKYLSFMVGAFHYREARTNDYESETSKYGLNYEDMFKNSFGAGSQDGTALLGSEEKKRPEGQVLYISTDDSQDGQRFLDNLEDFMDIVCRVIADKSGINLEE